MTRSRSMIERLEDRRLLAFGVTTTSGSAASYVIDNGADLKFTVLRNGATTSSTIHLGDITSIKYKNKEMLASYAVTSRYSHYEQGLGSTTAVSYTIGGGNSYIMVSCDDSASGSGGVIHYYLVRPNDNNIYMASLPNDVNGGPGEGRYIAYLDRNVFTAPEDPSDTSTTNATVEGSDVFYNTSTGITKSKFYNTRRMIENTYHGLTGSATGTSVGAWMFMGNRETSSGGPFFKDIDFQSNAAVEIYNCLFTGHTQTEPFRQGLKGPYALQFTNGSLPVAPDYSWMDSLNLAGWVPASARGTLTGTASGVPSGHEVTVGLSNTTAQYWGTPNASGQYTIAGIRAGTYTETLYDNELAVGTRQVTINGGATTAADITSTYFTPSAANTIFRMGTWDGTPLGFLNSDKIEIMHPSDSRMSSWTATPNFVVGTNTDAQWPMVQFMGVNNGQRITFNLTAVQALTLRIGITLGFEGGRNRVTVNSGQSYAWTSSIPAASTDLNSRGITRGTYRGPNQLYTYNIPSSALRVGTNTIDLPVVSGSYVAGQTWLSPNVVYDAIDLVTTSSITNAPVVSSITVTPANPTVGPGATQVFTATARDQLNNVMPANVTWSTTYGTIDDTGTLVAPGTAGGGTVTATSGSVSGSTTINVSTGAGPTVATPAAATPNPANATSANLSVLGADDGGEAALTYTWAAVGSPPNPVTFSVNGTNAAKNTTATFTKAGTYDLQVTIADAASHTTVSNVNVVVGFGAFSESRDIGSPALAGSLTYAPATGSYTIKGAGADIWNTSDQFRYAYAAFGGNGQIIAHVVSTTNTNSSSKAGVMIRDSSAANAAYGIVWLSPLGTVKFETRASNGVAASFSTSASAGGSSAWVKLVRSGTAGNQLTAYYSANGITWSQLGTPQTVTLGSAALAGLAVTSHNTAALNTAVFDNVSLSATVTGDQSGSGQSDAFRIVRLGSALDVYLNNITSTPSYRYDYASLSGLTIAGAGGTDTLSVDNTAGPSIPAGGLTFDTGTGINAMSFNGASDGAVTVTGGGVTIAGAITSSPGFSLSISANASVALAASPVVVSSLSLAPNATLDVRDKQLIIRNADSAAVTAQIISGRNGGSWNGAGIITSMSDAQGAMASKTVGIAQSGDDVHVAYTFAGDIDLDGLITGDDFFGIDAGFLAGAAAYADGDFNYSGNVDGDDYFLINSNYNKAQLAPGPAIQSAAPAAATADYDPGTIFSSTPVDSSDELLTELL